MTPLFKRMPAKVVVAVAISLVAGLYATDTFDNARILGLLPFFVLGPEDARGPLEPAAPRRARAGTASRCCRSCSCWPGSPAPGSRPSGSTTAPATTRSDPDNLRAITIRMSLLLVGLVGAFAFFAVVPRTKTWFTSLGARHAGGLPVPRLRRPGCGVRRLQGLGGRPLAARPGAGHRARAVALAVLLAWRPVSSRLNALVDPIGRRSGRRRRGRAPARGDRVERHHVEPQRLPTGRGVAAEMGGVPRRDLARPRPVVRQPLQSLEQAGQRVAEVLGPLGQVVAPGRRTSGRRRRGRPGARGSVDRRRRGRPTEKIRWVPQTPTGYDGAPGLAGQGRPGRASAGAP